MLSRWHPDQGFSARHDRDSHFVRKCRTTGSFGSNSDQSEDSPHPSRQRATGKLDQQ
jgi:hypothetical protein